MKQKNTTVLTENTAILLHNRCIYADLLRIFATFGVIILHVVASKWYDTSVKSLNWQIMNLYDSLVRWSVPIFVMISGFLNLQQIKDDITFGEELKNIFQKIFKIIYVIVFWGIVYNCINMLGKYIIKNEAITLFDILNIFEKIIFERGYYHLWFLYMIIGLYLLTPIFRCFIKNCKREHIEYFLVLFFIIGTCVPFINAFLYNINGKAIFFSVAELSGYTGYYIAGYYFANYEIKRKTKICIYCFAILSALFTIIATSFISINKNEPTDILYGYLLPNTMFMAYGVFILFKKVCSKYHFSQKVEKMIFKISKNTLGIYLIHALVIQIFNIIGLNSLIIMPIISIPIISLIVMLISEIGTIIIKKIPVLKKHVI